MAEIITIPEKAIIKPIDIEINKVCSDKVVSIIQYDTNTVYIVATVWNDGELYPLTEDDVINFVCTKKDGNGVDNLAGIDSEGRIVYCITEQTSAKEGRFPASFRIYNSYLDEEDNTVKKLKSTASFNIYVEKSTLDDSTIISTPEATALDELVDDATQAISVINNKLDKTGDTKDNTTTFLEAETDTDIASGETHSTIFSKILKSIKTLRIALTDKLSKTTDIINDDVTGGADKVASAEVVKVHGGEIDAINTNLANYIGNRNAVIRGGYKLLASGVPTQIAEVLYTALVWTELLIKITVVGGQNTSQQSICNVSAWRGHKTVAPVSDGNANLWTLSSNSVYPSISFQAETGKLIIKLEQTTGFNRGYAYDIEIIGARADGDVNMFQVNTLS